MTKVRSVLMDLARGWSEPRVEVHSGLEVSIACAMRDPAKEPDFDSLRASVTGVPSALFDFWSYCNGADLFKDVTFGQWGLNLFSIPESVAASDKFARDRAIDAKPDDLVVGAFFGDSDLLLVRCAPDADDFGTVLVALPIDGRSDWHLAARDFESFLERYVQKAGEKFWARG